MFIALAPCGGASLFTGDRQKGGKRSRVRDTTKAVGGQSIQGVTRPPGAPHNSGCVASATPTWEHSLVNLREHAGLGSTGPINVGAADGTSAKGIAMPGSRNTLALMACGLALLVLYAPTVHGLAVTLWPDPTHSHGPLVLAVVAWLFARGIRHQLDLTPPEARGPTRPLAGALSFGLGLLAYVVGRSQSLFVLEVGSAFPVLLGLGLMVFGPRLLRSLWFPFVFMLFLVPLPGSFIDTVTHPMKLGVSWASEHLLAAMGYPIARTGVILNIGQYQMFVADACAGLTSLFMLEAFGLLYLNVVRHASALRNVILALLIVPISFASNVVRVVLLCLVTYHYGDEAGQGFVHDFSGSVLFAAALALTVAADTAARALARTLQRRRGGAGGAYGEPAASPGLWPRVRSWQGVGGSPALGAGVAAAAVAALALATALVPKPIAAEPVGDLERLIPARFGDWVVVDRPLIPVDVLANEPGETTLNSPYDQVVMRSYRNAASGAVVDLAVAYGKHQRQEVKIHQPELCFNSQGFRVTSSTPTLIERPAGSDGPAITARNLFSDGQRAKLAATYWIRIGKVYADSAWETRWEIFREGLSGRAVDGVLVRATMQVGSTPEAEQAHRISARFLGELLANGSPELRRALAP